MRSVGRWFLFLALVALVLGFVISAPGIWLAVTGERAEGVVTNFTQVPDQYRRPRKAAVIQFQAGTQSIEVARGLSDAWISEWPDDMAVGDRIGLLYGPAVPEEARADTVFGIYGGLIGGGLVACLCATLGWLFLRWSRKWNLAKRMEAYNLVRPGPTPCTADEICSDAPPACQDDGDPDCVRYLEWPRWPRRYG